jgi:hypothetical protein
MSFFRRSAQRQRQFERSAAPAKKKISGFLAEKWRF